MNVGVPKEIKVEEYRVGLIPEFTKYLVKKGHKVIVQKDAGIGAGFSDEEYILSGAEIVEKIEDVYERCELIVKVKEPQEKELTFVREGQVLFTFFHFSSNREMTEKLIEKKATCIAYELIEEKGILPILRPMSEIAGKLSIQEGMKYLEKEYGGKGILLSGAEGVRSGNVVIIGGGTVGYNAGVIAEGIGASIIFLEIDEKKGNLLKKRFKKADVLYSNRQNLKKALKKADVVIGAVLIPGRRTPVIIKEDDLKLMEKGSIIVDVSIDEGGICETSKPTTHKEPIFICNDILHYCVPNIPGVVPKTSTLALNYASFPYLKEIVKGEKNWSKNRVIEKGLAIYKGNLKREFSYNS